MNMTALAISCCLLIQLDNEGDPHRPRMERNHRAPAANINEPHEAAEEQPEENPEPGTAQEPPARHVPGHAAAEPGGHMTTVEGGGQQKPRPPEILAEALENPVEGALVGKPITLQAALARSNGDRQQQLRIAQAYWRLSAAQAEYHWNLNQRDTLRHYTESHTNLPETLSARAAARADVRDAQLAVAAAQEDLADLSGAGNDEQPPLASDRPHVGDYRTSYESLFGNRQAPPRIRLIHRILPVRRKAIDSHAEAIVATLDAVQATGDEFKAQGQGLSTLLAALDLLRQERRAFMEDVRAYNQEIAEYAFAVAPAGANDQTLVSMLIKTAPARPPAGNPPGRNTNQRTRRQENYPEGHGDASTPQEQRAAYQHATTPLDTTDDGGMYQGLLDMGKSAERADKLANTLHWDRNLPTDAGDPLTLAACLRGVSPANRLKVIAAYWQARERAAVYQSMTDQLEQLNVLPAIAVRLRDQPGMRDAGVRLQATRRAARAAVADAHVALLASSFDLAQTMGRRPDDPWVVPATPPQSGRYVVSNRKSAQESAQLRRLGHDIALHHGKIEERCDALLQADRHRAEMINETRRGAAAEVAGGKVADEPQRMDGAVHAIHQQQRLTAEFLRDLTEYNIAITRYALSLFPETISSDELTKKLVIERSTRRET